MKKFRSYDFDRKEMDYFDLDSYDKYYHDNYGTIMQFTGLLDINMTDIFEGDIVRCGYGTGVVIFMLGCFMVRWVDDPESLMEFVGFNNKVRRQREDDEMFEVIGNIYEHKHLLENIST